MSIHIGKIIHGLVEKQGIKAKILAKRINVSESTVYKIYQRQTIDIDKLIKLSQLFKENLFLYYLEQEPLKSMISSESRKLREEVSELKAEIGTKNKRIKELELLNASQQKVIAILERDPKKAKK